MSKEKYVKYKTKYLELVTSMRGGFIPEHIHKIEGPSTLAFYNIPISDSLTKKILILGENHDPSGKPCEDESCINIIDFLTELTKDKCIDFFLEFSPRKTEGYAMYGGDPLIIKLRRFALKLQEQSNVRVQKWDLRSVSKRDGISNPQLPGHKILLINGMSKQFLSEYNGNTYLNNIKEIHMYLYGLKSPDQSIRTMISMMSIYCHIKDVEFVNYFQMREIMQINEDISIKFNNSEYIQLLKFIMPILHQIISSHDIDYVIKKEEDDEIKYREKPDAQRLYYDSTHIEKVVNITNRTDELFTEEFDKYPASPIKTLFNKYRVIIAEYINKIVYVRKINTALNNEILFYEEMVVINHKIDKLYTKFLVFCERYPGVFERGIYIKETLIDIITSESQFATRFNAAAIGGFEMGLHAAVSDLYAILRIFTVFEDNKKGPIKCSDTHTPKYVIMYAGKAHTSLYESVFAYYNFKHVLQICDNVNKEPLNKEKYILDKKRMNLRARDVYIRDKLLKNQDKINVYEEKIRETRENTLLDTYKKKIRVINIINYKYNETREKLKIHVAELQKKILQINDILSKKLYSDRSINLMNSGKTVNYLITDFLSDQ